MTLASSPERLNALNAAKNNPSHKPAQILCLRGLAEELIEPSALFNRLAPVFNNGGLTIIANASNKGSALQGGLKTIGLRAPKHKFIMEIMKYAASPLFCSSANTHGLAVAETPAELIKIFDGKTDFIITGGTLRGQPSAVLDIASGKIKVIRRGSMSEAELNNLLL
jgi:L-threonylcarbamoyladenylate synthase